MTRPVSPTLQVTSGAMLVALAMVWGGSFFFAEIALRELPPLTITLHRVFWAVPVLLAAVLGNGIEIPRSARVWLAYLVMGALNNAIPFSLIFLGANPYRERPRLDPERHHGGIRSGGGGPPSGR
ncbi:DMT family transporter [Albidovulum salinarum]|uniref:DMT family transporter n=1 Tax=Albidovulum salinarum TaxID=2984153 RepID=UPI0029585629|nr:DMT family transporter [Defluviimonas sp. WL0024]